MLENVTDLPQKMTAENRILSFLKTSVVDGFWEYDEKNEEKIDDSFWEILKCNQYSSIKRGFLCLVSVHPEDWSREISKLRTFLYDSVAGETTTQHIRYIDGELNTSWIEWKFLNNSAENKHFFGTFRGITESKRLENILKIRDDREKQIIQATGISLWEWNIRNDEFIFNEKWANILGRKLHELFSSVKELEELTHPDDLAKSKRLILKHFSGKSENYECELRIKHSNGNWVWVLSKGKVISRDQYGKPEWMVGSYQDISDRKQNEILLANYQDLLERTNEAAKIGTWELYLKDQTIFWSDVTKRIHEEESDYVPSYEGAIKYFPEGKYRDMITTAVTEAIEFGKNYDLELKILTAKKNLKWVRAIGISDFLDGECVRFYGLFQDIDEATKSNRKIIEQEEQLRLVFDNAPNGIGTVSTKGYWLSTNEAMTRITGYSNEELLSKTFEEITHPDDVGIGKEFVDELFRGERESYRLEKRYIHKNGTIIWVDISASAVRVRARKITKFVVQVNDISENKILSNITKEQNQRLLNFAHIVSHNLRSHSTNFSLMLDLMNMHEPEATKNDFFPMLEKASDNLKETISHLNEVTLIQTKINENFEEANLYDYIENNTKSVSAILLDSDFEIQNLVEKKATVSVIPAYLESIILNFITNAIKYRAKNRQSYLKIYLENTENHAILVFEDNGLGIDLKAHSKRIFGMYKTFHKNDDAKGIGLFITKNQVEVMGGKIEVESKVNEGTKFSVFLKHS